MSPKKMDRNDLASQRLLYLISKAKKESDEHQILHLVRKIRALHEDGADINYVDEDDGMTPLGHAIHNNLPPVIELVAELGCNMDVSVQGFHPLFIASKVGSDCVDLLIHHGSGSQLSETNKASMIQQVRESIGEMEADHIQRSLFENIGSSLRHEREHNLFDFSHVQNEEKLEKNQARHHYLKLLTASGPYRTYSKTPDTSALDPLYKKFPNFHEVLDDIKRQISLALLSKNSILTMSPILLHGAPGIGKTKFIRELSAVMQFEFWKLNCGAVTAGWIISGSSTSWQEGRPGLVHTSLRDGQTGNPIIMLDELDKLSSDPRFNAYGGLYELLEDSTATGFTDEAVNIAFDCSRITWIATANDLYLIPAPILSRMKLIEVEAPNEIQIVDTIASIVDDILNENADSWGSRFSREITPDVFNVLKKHTPRDIRNELKDAMGEAAANRNEEVYVLQASDFVSLRQRRRPAGF